MKQNFRRPTIAIIFLISISFTAWAAPLDPILAEAKKQFAAGNFSEAYTLLVQSAPESADAGTKNQVADLLTEFGVDEYGIKNFKNAWEALRSALKLKPTNQTATTYYLKIKREQDITNLQNLGKRAAPAVVVTQPVADPVADNQKAAAAAMQAEELKKIMDQLKSAEAKLNSAETTVNSSKSESDFYKKQLEEQRKTLEKLLTAQAANPTKTPNTQDTAMVQKTLNLLAEIANQNKTAPAPQVVVQSDPAIQALVERLEKNATNNNDGLNWGILIGIVVLILIILTTVILILVAFRRARNSAQNRERFSGETLRMTSGSSSLVPNQITGRHPQALLGFVTSGETNAPGQLTLGQSLIKADRLQKMYDEMRNNTLSWETIKTYMDELSTALKSEILSVVDRKISSGDLFHNEAVLPILFPFLTEYDDFLRTKANSLAKTALLTESTSEDDVGALSIRELLNIPKRLEEVLKGRDRSLITAKLSRQVSKELGYSEADCLLVYKSALAHDAGYLMMDQDVLQMILGKGEISEAEYETIKSHATLGLKYFNEIEMDQKIKDGILYHHERNDGSGYPNGLKKGSIPEVALIIGACETFSALISNRPHRDKIEISHALAIIKDGGRMKFDKEIVDALVAVITTSGLPL